MTTTFTYIFRELKSQCFIVCSIVSYLLIFSFSLNAQQKSIVEINNDSKYMQIHDEFKRQLDPSTHQNNFSQKSTQNDLTFLLDTVYVNSVSSTPKRYTYTYSEDGYRLSALLEKNENGAWEFVNLEMRTYDSVGNILTSLWRTWNNGSFVNNSKNTFTYTTNGNVTTSFNQIWENGAWVNNNRSNYSYNTAGNVVLHLFELWANTFWYNSTKELYIYDDNSNMLLAFGDVWADTVWLNNIKYTYTYDAQGNMLTGINQVWGVVDWDNVARETYTYNDANNRLSYIGEIWNDTVWLNNNKIEYTYNALDYLHTSISEIWVNGTWDFSQKNTYMYSTFGGIESLLIEVWEDYNWVNFSLSQYNYDEYGNSLSGQYLSWDGSVWTQNTDGLLELNYNYSTEYEYFIGYSFEGAYSSIIVGINNNDNIATDMDVSFGPNPSSGISTLWLNVNTNGFADICMYSSNGMLINKIYQGNIQTGKHHLAIATADMPNGLYFIKINKNNSTEIIKVIVANN